MKAQKRAMRIREQQKEIEEVRTQRRETCVLRNGGGVWWTRTVARAEFNEGEITLRVVEIFFCLFSELIIFVTLPPSYSPLTPSPPQVAILQSDPMKEAPKHTFTRLSSKMELKRVHHDSAYKTYRASLRALSDEIEGLYVKEADCVKELLGGTDESIQFLFDELNQDSILEMKPLTYVTEMWENINALLTRRTSEVTQFSQNLESFEVTRSTTLAQYLREMVDLMANIGLLLPQEIERVAEIEAYELNGVITGNRRAHAELNARMEKVRKGI